MTNTMRIVSLVLFLGTMLTGCVTRHDRVKVHGVSVAAILSGELCSASDYLVVKGVVLSSRHGALLKDSLEAPFGIPLEIPEGSIGRKGVSELLSQFHRSWLGSGSGGVKGKFVGLLECTDSSPGNFLFNLYEATELEEIAVDGE